MLEVLCDYCGLRARLVTGKEVYPHRADLWSKKIYQCKPCGAHVGTHEDSGLPLGRLSNAKLRNAKMAAHAAFDPLWKKKRIKREDAYKWLADQLGITADECHIGSFDEDLCARVIKICRARKTLKVNKPCQSKNPSASTSRATR